MKYAVVCCPKCKNCRLAKYPFKRIKCFTCGRSLSRKNVMVVTSSREVALAKLAAFKKRRFERKSY